MELATAIAYHTAINAESFDTKPAAEQSEKGKKAEAYILSGAFGCNAGAVARLVSILLDEPIAESRFVGPSVKPGAIVALLDSNRPVLVSAQHKDGSLRILDAGVNGGGSQTNLNRVRRATADEIAVFCRQRYLGEAPAASVNTDADF